MNIPNDKKALAAALIKRKKQGRRSILTPAKRAEILGVYLGGKNVVDTALQCKVSPPMVARCIKDAIAEGTEE